MLITEELVLGTKFESFCEDGSVGWRPVSFLGFVDEMAAGFRLCSVSGIRGPDRAPLDKCSCEVFDVIFGGSCIVAVSGCSTSNSARGPKDEPRKDVGTSEVSTSEEPPCISFSVSRGS